jgi:hypothetical protein
MANFFNKDTILQNRVFSVIKIFFFVTILWYVGLAFLKAFQDIHWSSVSFSNGPIILGAGIAFLSTAIGSWILQGIFGHLQARISWSQAFVLLSLPPLGKYLPSKIFTIAGYVGIAKLFGISIMKSGAVSFLLLGLGLGCTMMLGLLLMSVGQPNSEIFQYKELCLLSGFLLVLLHPRIYWRLINAVLAIFKQPPVIVSLSLPTMVAIFLKVGLQNGLYLCGISIMVGGVVELPYSMIPSLIGIACVANVTGFIAIFAPAGIGVREAVFLIFLTPLVGNGNAVLISLMMRLFQTSYDLFIAGIGVVFFQKWKKTQNKNHGDGSSKKLE